MVLKNLGVKPLRHTTELGERATLVLKILGVGPLSHTGHLGVRPLSHIGNQGVGPTILVLDCSSGSGACGLSNLKDGRSSQQWKDMMNAAVEEKPKELLMNRLLGGLRAIPRGSFRTENSPW